MSQTASNQDDSSAGLPSDERVLNYVLGELPDQERADFEAELQRNDLLRLKVYDTEALVSRLRTVPPERVAHDLSVGILRAIEQEEPRILRVPSSFWRPALAAAACLLLAVGGWFLIRAPTIAPPPATAQAAITSGLEWLVNAQGDAGGWDAASLGGHAEYAVALNGLAVLTLARTPGVMGRQREALARATGFLLAQQAADGHFGRECGGLMYNHGMATLALLEVYRVTSDQQLRQPISAALDFIRSQQHASGGWSYTKAPASRANTGVSVWQIQALLSAVGQGWKEHRRAAEKGLAWLNGVTDGRGFFGYEQAGHFPEGSRTLTSMGAYCAFTAERERIPAARRLAAGARRGLSESVRSDDAWDYYQAYFQASALHEAGDEEFLQTLSELQADIVALQVQRGGAPAGSWEPDDRWGRVGGRLYSTTMAMLALTPGRG
ncbi:MAG: terpene cyclase/mutase family protein [Kiritimatiellae bacterium]|nr:terpene cyclase/mutase family protein [Kiritimatiellia bacterium]